MTCASCNLPILPGQDYEVSDKTSGSGAGITFHFHRLYPPRRTTVKPARPPHRPA